MKHRRKTLRVSAEFLVDVLSCRLWSTVGSERISISVKGLPEDLSIVGCRWEDSGLLPEGHRVIVLLVESKTFTEAEEGEFPEMVPPIYTKHYERIDTPTR